MMDWDGIGMGGADRESRGFWSMGFPKGKGYERSGLFES